MAGIINSAMQGATQPNAAPSAAPTTNIADPILKKTKLGIEAKIGPQIKKQFLSIENAGLALLSSGNMMKLALQKIQGSQDLAGTVSDGVANIIATIYNQVAPKMQGNQQFNDLFVAAAPSAGISLMCQVLDMAKQALNINITQQLVAQCSQATAQKVLAKFHITNQQIQQAVAAGKQAQAGA
jgi:hypothetical protein